MRTRSSVFLLLAHLALSGAASAGSSIDPEEVVVTVNDVPIHQREVLAELDRRINIYAAESLTKGLIYEESSRDQTRAAMREEAIHGLIERQLIANQLKADGIEVTDADVEAYFLAKVREKGQTLAEAKAEIKDQGKTLPQVKERIHWNVLAIQRLYAAHAQDQKTLTDAEALRFYMANLKVYEQQHERRVSRILINATTEENPTFRAHARARAEAVLKRLKAGEDFAELAKKYSEDILTRSRGGDRGWSPRGHVTAPGNDPFGDIAFAMKKVGDTTDVVETLDGYEIIKLTGLKEARQKSFDEVKAQIIADDRYQRIARFWQQYAAGMQEKARIVWSPAEKARKAEWDRKIAAGTEPTPVGKSEKN